MGAFDRGKDSRPVNPRTGFPYFPPEGAIAVALFDHAKANYSVYPDVLGYHYLSEMTDELVQKINEHDFVFIASDISKPIPGCEATQVMTSSDSPETWMWLQQDFSNYQQMPASEYTEVPTVGFVGRVPVFGVNGNEIAIHKGFETRSYGIRNLMNSTDVCTDFHVHTKTDGDSCGFWNGTRPDFKKNGPLFKTNMLANQYQLCARGNANWSLRFYETLAYGRIPILLDTGGKFPLYQGSICEYQDAVDGFPFPVIYDMDDLESELLEYHSGLNRDRISILQMQCREFYEDYFSQAAQIIAWDYYFEGYKNGR